MSDPTLKSALEVDLEEEYKFIGCIPTKIILELSVQLCLKYNLNAEDFVNQWSAFTLNNLNGAAPTVDTISLLDRKVLAKESETKPSLPISDHSTPIKYAEKVDTSPSNSSKIQKNDKKRPRSPLSESDDLGKNESIVENTIPATNDSSITINNGPVYNDRKDAGKIIVSFGKWQKSLKKHLQLNIKQYADNCMSSIEKYMHEVLAITTNLLKTTGDHCSEAILKNNELTIKFGANTAGHICVCGRVTHHAEGKLTKDSVTIHFSYDKYNVLLEMNVSKVDSFSLFPGQVIVATGNLTKENRFTADKIYSSAFPPKSTLPINITEPLNIVVAGGPFTTIDNLSHEPLQDLLSYVLKEQPDILILIGPFMTVEHNEIERLPTNYEDFFEQVIETIMSHLTESPIQVILISSHRDVHHSPVYPTHPYTLSQSFPNLHCMPDPCLLDLDGILLAVTSADILMDLGTAECTTTASGGDRFHRLVSHLLGQQCFYPLYPSRAVPVDYSLLARFGGLPVMPHVLVVPSKFVSFVKKVDSCTVINPERLTKFSGGGTFTNIQVHPAIGNDSPQINCQVIKI